MFFIAPLLEDVELETAYFQLFTQRYVTATVQDMEIGGRVDFVVAKGKEALNNLFFVYMNILALSLVEVNKKKTQKETH